MWVALFLVLGLASDLRDPFAARPASRLVASDLKDPFQGTAPPPPCAGLKDPFGGLPGRCPGELKSPF